MVQSKNGFAVVTVPPEVVVMEAKAFTEFVATYVWVMEEPVLVILLVSGDLFGWYLNVQ